MRDAFCNACGTALAVNYPKTCGNCGVVVFRNPNPVAVCLVPVPGGILTVQRAIPPKVGGYALPGGFVDWGESWQNACIRELREETGVVVDAVELFDTVSTPDGVSVLIFGVAAPLVAFPPFQPNGETLALGRYDGTGELAFPLHTRVARSFLGTRS